MDLWPRPRGFLIAIRIQRFHSHVDAHALDLDRPFGVALVGDDFLLLHVLTFHPSNPFP
jgi:hypothetical protein